MAIAWFCAAVVLMIALGALILAAAIRTATRTMQIDPDKFLVPAATPVPPAEELPETWVRYDVDLDDELQRYIAQVCREYEIEAAVVMAMIEAESGCDPNRIGDGGRSYGLMQIMAGEHTERCVRLGAWNLLDPRANIRVGVDFLAELRDCGHGIEWALSWYNGHGGEPCGYAYAVLTEAERLLESAALVTE